MCCGGAGGIDTSGGARAAGRIGTHNAPPQQHNTTQPSIGVSATHEVEEGDDAFDQYRKRMMLAYRFRPNPLNNPRRAYY